MERGLNIIPECVVTRARWRVVAFQAAFLLVIQRSVLPRGSDIYPELLTLISRVNETNYAHAGDAAPR